MAGNTQWLSINPKILLWWFQLIHAIPRPWRVAVLNDKENCKNIIYLNHHLIKNNQILAIEKFIPKRTARFMYCSEKWTSYVSKIFLQHFPQFTGWRERDLFLPHIVSIATTSRMFQYKILNNISYLKKTVFHF